MGDASLIPDSKKESNISESPNRFIVELKEDRHIPFSPHGKRSVRKRKRAVGLVVPENLTALLLLHLPSFPKWVECLKTENGYEEGCSRGASLFGVGTGAPSVNAVPALW